jgi:tetratricopeptide (TPR) repeat protein
MAADSTPTLAHLSHPRVALEAVYTSTGEPEPPETCRVQDPAMLTQLVTAAEQLARRPQGQANEEDFKAFEGLRAFSESSPEPFAASAEAQTFFARALLRNVSLPAEALPPAKKAVELCPDWALAHNVLGNVHQAMTSFDDARRAYTSASTLLPVWGVPRFNLALVELGARQPKAAITVLDRLLTDHPEWPNAHLLRAQARLGSGDKKNYPLAEADALRATELTPTREQAWFMLGESRRAQKLVDAAKEAYCKAKELGSSTAAAHCP